MRLSANGACYACHLPLHINAARDRTRGARILAGFFWKDLAASLVLAAALFMFLKDRYQAFRTAGRSPFYALPR